MKVFIKSLCIPLIVAVIGCILLLIVSLIPQRLICHNASISATQMADVPGWEHAILKDYAYQMDNLTDSIILMQSYNLTSSNTGSMITNPYRSSPDGVMKGFDELVNQGEPNTAFYVRYWLGFRVFIRPLLMIASYSMIRRLFAIIFFILLAGTIAVISKKLGIIRAACFGAAIAMVNPGIVAHSLQFSCVFFLTFIFSIYICIFQFKHLRMEYLFCLFGVLTQFFDFYTTPVMTWGIPLLLIYLMEEKTSMNSVQICTIIKSFLFWLLGYGCMWIIKLALVTIFTDINGFTDGFTSFAGRTGIVTRENLKVYYNASEALKAVWRMAFPGIFGKIALLCAIFTIVTSVCILLYHYRQRAILYCLEFSMIAAIPHVWYAIAAQPTNIHAMFQYRSICVVLFAFFVFTSQAVMVQIDYIRHKKSASLA